MPLEYRIAGLPTNPFPCALPIIKSPWAVEASLQRHFINLGGHGDHGEKKPFSVPSSVSSVVKTSLKNAARAKIKPQDD
jgi:hypothetical protein